MVRQDIVSALRNAMDRSYSLQQAKITLINAGYAPTDIDVAANYLISSIEYNNQFQQMPKSQQIQQQSLPQQIQQTQFQQLPTMTQTYMPKKRSYFGLIMLIIILILLLILLGVSLIFKEEIVGSLKTLFG